MHIPNLAVEITEDCNLNCRYCYNHWRPDSKLNKSKNPDKRHYSRAIRLLEHLFKIAKIDNVTFTGGEPFCSNRFDEVVLYTRLKGKSVSIITNGNTADKATLTRVVKMGIELFELPYHSAIPEIHDSMTNKRSSWKHVVQTISILHELGAFVVPVIVLTKFNHSSIEETLDSLIKMRLKRIMVNRFNIGGNGISNAGDLMLTPDELRNVFKRIDTFAANNDVYITSNVCIPFCVLDPTEFKIPVGSCPSDVMQRPLTVNVNGDLRLCNHSPVIAGNIYKTSLEEILHSAYVNDWVAIKPEYCKTCAKFDKCLGGCRAAAEQVSGSLAYADPIIHNNIGIN